VKRDRTSWPRITFGIIVLNGEPFTRYCLRSLYPFAHQIIVVEGGHSDTRAVATPDGHSIDGTLDALRRFKAEEDPLGKVELVTWEGFWPKTDEFGNHRTHQSRAYAERATGDYLWQVDIDEFYRPEDMCAVLTMLQEQPSISAVSFRTRSFFGGLRYVAESWYHLDGARDFNRLFRWGPGYRYVTHEPPTVIDASGRDLRTLHWVRAEEMARRGVFLYHYEALIPWQVEQKMRIYQDEKPQYGEGLVDWARHSYFRLERPYSVHRDRASPSWLRRFDGPHPPEVRRMMSDVMGGRTIQAPRGTEDIERMLRRWWYPLGRQYLLMRYHLDRRALQPVKKAIRSTGVYRSFVHRLRARGLLGPETADMTYVMYHAMLACLESGTASSQAIARSQAWLAEHPVGSGVTAHNPEWQDSGEAIYKSLETSRRRVGRLI